MFIPSAILLAAMSLDEKIFDATTLAIVGMGTVIVCLLLIGGVFDVLKNLISPQPPAAPTSSAPASESAPPQPADAPGIDAHLIPVIAAAATAIVGRRVMVHRITFINSNTVSGWAEAGRTSIHQSHNLRRN